MGKLEEEYPARHAPIRSTPETYGLACDMCEHLECVRQEGARVHKWKYHCHLLAKERTVDGVNGVP